MTDDETRWAAVNRRERDARFVYAVRTTGVYCVPACPSRRPNRENVEFFGDAAEAEAAGYRACKRCEPGSDASADTVAAVCRFITGRGRPPSLQAMADHVGLSPSHLHRVFKQHTGQTPRAFAADIRAARVRDALTRGASVTAALYEAGYGSASRFYSEVEARLGMPPARYRDRGRGIEVRSAVTEVSLGFALVAATGRGVCAVALGDNPQALVEALRQRFANASFVAADDAFEHTVAAVSAALDGEVPPHPLPLDLRGTVFQHRVWQALAALPRGETTTYAQLAAAIGRPDAVRAVASACGANELAVLVPCHRVVGSDGALRGYRWGLERKRALLAREAE